MDAEHLLLTRVVVRPPSVAPETTKLVDVFLARKQWTAEETRDIKDELDRLSREELTLESSRDRNTQRLDALKPMLYTISDTPMAVGMIAGPMISFRMGCDALKKEVYSKLQVLPRGAS